MTNAQLIDTLRAIQQQQKHQENRIDLLLVRVQWLEQRVKELEKEREMA